MGKRAAKIREERAEISERIEELENSAAEIKSALNISRRWEDASFEQKRGVCGILISKILIEKNGDTEIVWNL
jgi:hypothetical protein